eukprot:713795-Pleurochrysis_carterae.AAC.1
MDWFVPERNRLATSSKAAGCARRPSATHAKTDWGHSKIAWLVLRAINGISDCPSECRIASQACHKAYTILNLFLVLR